MYILLGGLVIGLAGFGIGAGSGISSQSVARVGSNPVTADDYVRAMQQELRALQQQTGRSLTMAEARQYGVDNMVLARLVNDAALDGEAERLGLSTGDDAVRAQVTATPAFHGTDGTFDRETYTAALERGSLTPGEFEELLRRESTRDLLAGGVQSAATLPDSGALTVLAFLGERRSFDWLRLDAALLPEPIPAPTDADLAAEHDAHAADRYTRPETRQVAYASITPDALAAEIEIPEAELRAAYDAGIDHFQTPEQRALDRIGFGTDAEAAEAKARIDAGETDFDARRRRARPAARRHRPGHRRRRHPRPRSPRRRLRPRRPRHRRPGRRRPLGPALFRINAIMAPKTIPFEEARAGLAEDRAADEANKRILDETAHIQDLIAGGATLEEIASETPMQLGSVALNSETTGGIADDPAFRQAALAADVGEETDLIELAGGGLATLRVEKIDPPAVIPLPEIRDRVAADWTEARTADALQKLADGYTAELEGRAHLRRAGRSGSTARSGAPARSPAAISPRARRPSSWRTSSPRRPARRSPTATATG